MMRWLAWLVVLCAPIWALDNSVTIHDAASAAHTARPVLIHRWFAQGEIPGYAKPRVGGVVPAAWQCDVMSRWDDGSLRVAYVSWRQDIAAGASVGADFVSDANRSSAGGDAATSAAAMDQAAMLGFDAGDGGWNVIVEGTLNSISYGASARTMMQGGAWRYWLRGPVVTWVVVEDKTTALAYDFGWQYTGGAWGAPGGEQYKSLHPVFMVQFWPDPDGAGGMTAWPGVEVEAIVYNASTTRLQRIPLDRLRVLTGAAGTTEKYCAGSGCSVASAGTPNMIARRSWHTVQWSGTAPADVVVDYNFAYMVYSKALLAYDTKINFPQSKTDTMVTTYNSASVKPEWCDPASANCYLWTKYVPNTGGRGDIAPIPSWYMYYLYGMGNASWAVGRKLEVWNKLLLGNADAATSYPVHYIETDAARTGSRAYFDDAGTVGAFGHVTSVNSRLTIGLRDKEKSTDQNVAAADAMDPVCTAAPCDGSISNNDATYAQKWTPELAHQPSMFYLPALLTGRPFWIWEQYHLSNWAVMGENPWRGGWNTAVLDSSCSTPYYGNGGPLALRLHNNIQLRGMAWAMREIYLGAAVAPSSDAEGAYFAQRLKVNDAAAEGVWGITDGLYPPADASCAGYVWTTSMDPWCVGKMSLGSLFGVNSLRVPHVGNGSQVSNSNGNFAAGIACSGLAPWQMPFWLSSLTWANQSGVVKQAGRPVFDRVRREYALYETRIMTDAEGYPPALSFYSAPSTRWNASLGRAEFPATHAAWREVIDTSGTLSSAITASDTTATFTGRMASLDSTAHGWTYSIPIGVLWVENEAVMFCKLSANPRGGTSATLTICAGGRGALGTTAAAHDAGSAVRFQHVLFDLNWTLGYTMVSRAGLALVADLQTRNYSSGKAALERVLGGAAFIATPTDASHGAPMWTLEERRDPKNVRAVAGTGAVTLRYNAPDLAACRYTAAASLADSSDAGDTSDGGGPVARTVTVSGLSAGAVRYRISCGTGRTLGTATIQ